MGFKTVLFDLGGTLVDYPPLDSLTNVCERHWKDIIGTHPEVLMRMCEIYGEERKESFQTLRETALYSLLDRAFKEHRLVVDNKICEAILARLYYFWIRSYARMYKGVPRLLKELKGRDMKIGLISNTPFAGRFHDEDLRRFKILSYFDVRVWSSEFGFRKPHPKIFYEALRVLDSGVEESVYIGDHFDQDVKGSNSIGMPAIWINRNEGEKAIFGWQVKELNEILEIPGMNLRGA